MSAITKAYIQQLLPTNPVIVEAGAHKGRDTVKMAKLWPEGRIYAFEPIPEIFKILNEATQSYSNVKKYNLALGSYTGTAQIHISSGSSDAASSLLTPQEYLRERANIFFEKTLEVPTITLDDWALKEKVEYIDFLWLDMQGFEYAMLRASPNILRTVKLIFTEINYTQRYTGHPLFEEYKAWLEDQGFKLLIEDKSRPTWGNALFIKD